MSNIQFIKSQTATYQVVLDVQADRIVVGTMYPFDSQLALESGESIVSYEEYHAWLVSEEYSHEINFRAGGTDPSPFTFVTGLPEDGEGRSSIIFKANGRLGLFKENFLGYSEFTEGSILDFIGQRGTGQLSYIRNRTASTAATKASHSARSRIVEANPIYSNTIVNVCLPFKVDSLMDAGFIGVNYNQFEPLGTVPDSIEPERGTGVMLQDLMYHVELDGEVGTINADGYTTVNVKLVHYDSPDYKTTEGTLVNKPITLYANAVNGYVPKQRVDFVDGKATIKVGALGLESGDVLRFKIDGYHYTGIGDIEIPVV